MATIRYNLEDKLVNYDGVVGKALLQYRTGIKDHCAAYDPFGMCNVMQCLYCENCYYKITLENGEAIANTNIDLETIDSYSRGFEDDDHEILFYDYVPKIDDLFSYLFDENSQYKVVRTSDNLIMNDYVKPKTLTKINKSSKK